MRKIKLDSAYFRALDGPPTVRRLLRLLSAPYLLSRAGRFLPDRWLPTQIYMDSLERPHYAYGLYTAALQAKALGYEKITAIEFGVASGLGLVALESLARRIGKFLQVDIEVHGFDTGMGMPKPVDYRDHPYLWREGDYKMDETRLRACLSSARLWLGPAGETLPEFVSSSRGPVGFVAFDLDFYSSTVDALALFETPASTRLPRVLCYFDDINGPDYAFYTEAAGELLAIAEFNGAHPKLPLSPLRSIKYTKLVRAHWHEQMYVLHDLNHPHYADDFQPESERQFAAV